MVSRLHPTATCQLLEKGFLDQNGSFDFSEKQVSQEKGRHLVMSMEIPVEGFEEPVLIYLKLFPDLPMVDIAATELATLLVGPHLPWVELVKIQDASQKSIPALICEGVRGEMPSRKDFQSTDSDNNEDTKKLDLEEYSKCVIIGMILNPEDGKDSNFIFRKSKASPKLGPGDSIKDDVCFGLISVDNDRSFYPSLMKNGVGEIFPQVKDISFLFDEMNQKIFPTVCESFLMLDPRLILENWLKILEKYERSKNILFSEKEQQELFPGHLSFGFSLFSRRYIAVVPESFLKFFLPKKTMETLFWKLFKIKSQLLDFPDSTHLDLLKTAEPYLSTFYEKLLDLEKISPIDRFQIGFGKFYGVSASEYEKKIAKKGETLKTNQSGFHTLVAKHGAAVSETEMEECMDLKVHKNMLLMASEKHLQLHELLKKNEVEILDEWTTSSTILIQELLLSLDLSTISEHSQVALFNLLVTNKNHLFQMLCFKNSTIIDLPLLAKILQAQTVLYTLTLSNCLKLNQPGIFDQIYKSSSNLVELQLEGFELDKLKFCESTWFNFQHSGLKSVLLKNCKIPEISADLPKLTRFQMINCAIPTHFKIWQDMNREKYIEDELMVFNLLYVCARPNNNRKLISVYSTEKISIYEQVPQ
jgi:hypothetical protein